MLPHLLLRSSVVGRLAVVVATIGVLILPAVAGAAAKPSAASAGTLGTTTTLRSGNQGGAVKALQTLLRKAGFKTPIDGQFGADTTTVVQRFQRAANLKVTGVADSKTIAALRRATSGRIAINRAGGYDAQSGSVRSTHLGDRIPLVAGMSGHDVKVLQDFLRRAGFKVALDGAFGSGTQKQVKAFEAAQQLPVDGIVDANDIAQLRSLSEGDPVAAGVTTIATATNPGAMATVGSDGLASAPDAAPDAVKQIIAAGNAIAKKPYIYGGGHGRWQDSGYDCSGSVSYALHGAGLLDTQLVSGDFMRWGDKGPGQWVTIYGNSGHVYMVVAGLRFDTSGRAQDGTRWHKATRSSSGYAVVHPTGL